MTPFMYFTEDMLIKKETSKEEVDYLQFMNPFENEVWFCTLATLVIISISVFVINYFSPYGYKDEEGKRTSEEFNYFNSLWFSVACMLQQGGDNTPRSLSGSWIFMLSKAKCLCINRSLRIIVQFCYQRLSHYTLNYYILLGCVAKDKKPGWNGLKLKIGQIFCFSISVSQEFTKTYISVYSPSSTLL